MQEFDTTRMVEGEDSLESLGRVDKAGDHLAMIQCSKSAKEVDQDIVQNLSTLYYNIRNTSIPSRPGILRSEVDEIVRDTYLADKVERT